MASSSPYDNATDGAAESAISPLLDVENLRVSYQVRDNHGKRAELSAVAGMTFHINAGRDSRTGRRVRMREVHAR